MRRGSTDSTQLTTGPNLLVGIVGAFLGGFLFSTVLGFSYTEGLSLGSIVVATVGAIVLLWLVGMMRGNRRLT